MDLGTRNKGLAFLIFCSVFTGLRQYYFVTFLLRDPILAEKEHVNSGNYESKPFLAIKLKMFNSHSCNSLF